jgi:predicted metal-dependent HD superfamily phosphohydrolase
MTDEQMRERWKAVWEAGDSRVSAETVFGALAAAYGAPDRHYHTLGHVADCLETLDSCRDDADDPMAIEIALWFHDAVYDTHAADNEEQSAAWAVREIGDGDLAETVRRLILATKHGAATSSNKDSLLIADIDLAILGADESVFWAYEDAIRREYEWVPLDVFRSKRAEILTRFLQQDRLYRTPRFHVKFDERARTNLTVSIARLTSTD